MAKSGKSREKNRRKDVDQPEETLSWAKNLSNRLQAYAPILSIVGAIMAAAGAYGWWQGHVRYDELRRDFFAAHALEVARLEGQLKVCQENSSLEMEPKIRDDLAKLYQLNIDLVQQLGDARNCREIENTESKLDSLRLFFACDN
ncbi:hypothetical protein [Lewinella sp. IMCC34191]|uniref:hypothetical protein n=1 Tax=Lewinella sp. IMCC34191 TaxID=2259172 RepID=UPI000E22320E|nr:hypothetical protein [Lewinella sp. IMCC34191]